MLTLRCVVLLLFMLSYGNAQNMNEPSSVASLWNSLHVTPEREAEILSKIKLQLYYGYDTQDYMEKPLNQSTELMNFDEFNDSYCTAIYVPGYTSRPTYSDTRALVNAYLKRGNYNMIVVDWTSVTFQSLIIALKVLEKASKLMAVAFDALIDSGANICHLSGHSFGAQSVGYIGRNMKHKLKHIISMDPMGIMFYNPFQLLESITRNDASCVEVIHTDGKVVGTLVPTGTKDYYVNGGFGPQPGCPILPISFNFTQLNQDLGCSHARAPLIFSDAILYPKSLKAKWCWNWLAYKFAICNFMSTTYIGECDNKAGTFFLRTNSKSPYA